MSFCTDVPPLQGNCVLSRTMEEESLPSVSLDIEAAGAIFRCSLGTSYCLVWLRNYLFYSWKRWKSKAKDHWKNVYQYRHKVEKEILAVLDRISVQYGGKADVSHTQYESLTYLTSNSPYADYFECTLEEIIDGNPEIPRWYYILACLLLPPSTPVSRLMTLWWQRPAWILYVI